MENSDCKQFAGNWMVLQTLGEGAYGDVKLLMHKTSGETVAVKIVDLNKNKDAAACVYKEVKIHKLLDHPNIIKLYGNRRENEPATEYIYLEYASGGELFNKIEPDIGMPFHEAQKYMRQLLSGVGYLHQNGIVHRDIKPENLLLDANSNLKISDFGMATVFRLKGKERKLDKRCGTMPYIGPEVFKGLYFAQPADIWSCGIVLVAMIAGELPWKEPTDNCNEFLNWTSDKYLLRTPWSKLDNNVLSLVKKILAIDPSNRPSIGQILRHPWMLKIFTSSVQNSSILTYTNAKDDCTSDNAGYALSQPLPYTTPMVNSENLSELLKKRDHMYFSQPAQNDDLLISSQMQSTQTVYKKTDFDYMIKRMTRFFVKTSVEETLKILQGLFDSLLYTWHLDVKGFTISTVDYRKTQLIFKANLLKMDNKLLLDFSLSRGCGLEFKRRFLKLKNRLRDIILQDTPSS